MVDQYEIYEESKHIKVILLCGGVTNLYVAVVLICRLIQIKLCNRKGHL